MMSPPTKVAGRVDAAHPEIIAERPPLAGEQRQTPLFEQKQAPVPCPEH